MIKQKGQTMNEIPLYSVDLIDLLKEQYKEKCPDLKDTEREIFYYKGMVDLVNKLLNIKNNKEEVLNILTKREIK